MAITVKAQGDGADLPLDTLDQTFAYSGGNLTSISVSYNGNTYIQSFTYTGSDLTSVSGWVKQ
jgi:hypothetical protein